MKYILTTLILLALLSIVAAPSVSWAIAPTTTPSSSQATEPAEKAEAEPTENTEDEPAENAEDEPAENAEDEQGKLSPEGVPFFKILTLVLSVSAAAYGVGKLARDSWSKSIDELMEAAKLAHKDVPAIVTKYEGVENSRNLFLAFAKFYYWVWRIFIVIPGVAFVLAAYSMTTLAILWGYWEWPVSGAGEVSPRWAAHILSVIMVLHICTFLALSSSAVIMHFCVSKLKKLSTKRPEITASEDNGSAEESVESTDESVEPTDGSGS